MGSEGGASLDVSEFRCLAATSARVVVLFDQTNRRYTYSWENGELCLVDPAIEGDCGPHSPEVVDVLARAVAYRAARNAVGEFALARRAPPRALGDQLRAFLTRS